uniref:Uncharacterized protein n=1 Tax=Panagrolaimus superbus TaxID=310955 RepID=A0A914Y810_9BILA
MELLKISDDDMSDTSDLHDVSDWKSDNLSCSDREVARNSPEYVIDYNCNDVNDEANISLISDIQKSPAKEYEYELLEISDNDIDSASGEVENNEPKCISDNLSSKDLLKIALNMDNR